MNPFIIENIDKDKLTVIVEPWAEEYYLKKGDVLKLIQEDGLKGYYHLKVYNDGGIQIFVEGEFDYPLVKINDQDAVPFQDFL